VVPERMARGRSSWLARHYVGVRTSLSCHGTPHGRGSCGSQKLGGSQSSVPNGTGRIGVQGTAPVGLVGVRVRGLETRTHPSGRRQPQQPGWGGQSSVGESAGHSDPRRACGGRAAEPRPLHHPSGTQQNRYGCRPPVSAVGREAGRPRPGRNGSAAIRNWQIRSCRLTSHAPASRRRKYRSRVALRRRGLKFGHSARRTV